MHSFTFKILLHSHINQMYMHMFTHTQKTQIYTLINLNVNPTSISHTIRTFIRYRCSHILNLKRAGHTTYIMPLLYSQDVPRVACLYSHIITPSSIHNPKNSKSKLYTQAKPEALNPEPHTHNSTHINPESLS